jgi:hypothetical protein
MKKIILLSTLLCTLLLCLALGPANAQILSTITKQTHKHSLAVEPDLEFIGDTVIDISSAQPGSSAIAFCPVIADGDAPGTITRIVQTDATGFINLIGTLRDGNTWDPTQSQQTLSPGDTAMISIQYPVPVGTNDTVVDSLIAFNGFGDTISGPVTITIITQSTLTVAGNNESDASLQSSIVPANDGRSLEIVIPPNINGAIQFELANVLGESVLRATLGVGTQTVDASSIPRGVYFYRLTAGTMSQSGKVILGE